MVSEIRVSTIVTRASTVHALAVACIEAVRTDSGTDDMYATWLTHDANPLVRAVIHWVEQQGQSLDALVDSAAVNPVVAVCALYVPTVRVLLYAYPLSEHGDALYDAVCQRVFQLLSARQRAAGTEYRKTLFCLGPRGSYR